MLLKGKIIKIFSIIAYCFSAFYGSAQLTVSEIGILSEPVSNNAQCEGFPNGSPYLYSFGGIDSTKTYSGIHLRSYRYDISNNTSIQLPDLPDTLGKIAAAANRIGDTIYITGGYHVFQNGNELSSNKMYRFNTVTNSFMSDGPDLPVATDDHVQVVWRDSVLILITGWKNTGNITNVQIYNPSTNNWSVGTPIPNSHSYKSFGASGVIVEDTIYYFGGARSSFGFTIQNVIRKGVIHNSNPNQIVWSDVVLDPNTVGYRMAAVTVGNTMHWIGGSNDTYNYNGIAYNGSGGVPPNNRDLYTNSDLTSWHEDFVQELPMDLRGICNINDSVKYVMGGMIGNQKVTSKVYQLKWNLAFLPVEENEHSSMFNIYPMPFHDQFIIDSEFLNGDEELRLFNISGALILTERISSTQQILNSGNLPSGIYIVEMRTGDKSSRRKIVKLAY